MLSGLNMSPEDLVLTLYNRRLACVDDLTDHIKFEAGPTGTIANIQYTPDLDVQFCSLFSGAVLAYLNAPGHPEGSVGLVGKEMLERDADNTLCRANILLKGATDCELLPLGNWKIEVSEALRSQVLDNILVVLQFTVNTLPMWTTDYEALVPDVAPPPFRIATCSRQITVQYTHALHAYVGERISPGPPPSGGYKFDLWFHSQMLGTDYSNI
jgi:hypothetical protein